jgi:hypothetical protein
MIAVVERSAEMTLRRRKNRRLRGRGRNAKLHGFRSPSKCETVSESYSRGQCVQRIVMLARSPWDCQAISPVLKNQPMWQPRTRELSETTNGNRNKTRSYTEDVLLNR